MASAEEVVKQMLERLTDDDNASHFSLPAGAEVALIVNNLGGLSVLEMNIVAREAIKQLGRDSKS